jgi:hypothetical protein
MLGLLRRLFGNNPPTESRPLDRGASSFGEITPALRETDGARLYYETMSKMQGAIARGDYDDAAHFIRENVGQIPAWVRETHKQYGSFDIRSIPALQDGGKVLAFLKDDKGLAEMRRVVDATPELAPWSDLHACSSGSAP